MPTVAENFLDFAAVQMQQGQQEIASCVAQLSDQQMLHRGGPHENSIANLLLHLEGNIRQWILHGIANQPDVRRRDDEFTLAPPSPAQAFASFNATLDEARAVIAALPPDRLLITIDPQPASTWRNTTILEAIFKVAAHLQHHSGQVILLTKQLTRRDLDLSIPRKR